MKTLYIINPISGKGRGKAVPDILNNQNKKVHNYKIVFTKFAGEAREIALTYIAKGYKNIVAVGGDGTVNEVASAVADTPAAMGIIPLGSGNGLARHLGLPLDAEKAIQVIQKEHNIPMDMGKINEHRFFCTAGVGFDAHIGHVFAQASSRGFNTYLKATLKEYTHYKPQTYTITIDGKQITRKAFLITVANASQYGNNAYIAPQASINDGVFQVVIMHPFPLIAAPKLGLDLFRKKIHTSKYIETYTGKEIYIERPEAGVIHFDGEPAMEQASLHFSIHPQKLRMLIPKG